MSTLILPIDDTIDPDSVDDSRMTAGAETEALPASLVVMDGESAGRICLLGDRALIGRHRDCAVVLHEETISRRHAMIRRQPDGYYLHDLASQNGTYLNGTRLSVPTRLNDGDTIELDVVTLMFRSGEIPASGRVGGARRQADDGGRTATIVREASPLDRSTDVVTAIQVGDSIDGPTDVNARDKLRAVLAIARNLGRSVSCEQFLAGALESLFEMYPHAARGYVLLSDPAGRELRPAAIRQRRDESDSPATVRPLAQGIARRAMVEGEALLCSDRTDDDSAERDASVLPTSFTSVICAPLFVPSREALGVLYLDTQDHHAPFTRDDLDVLASVGALIGHAVEHARLYETQRELDRREDELAAARRVQRHLLPQDPPHVPDYNFFDYYRPALDVGGDYFSYIEMPDGRLAIAVGDVAGKGLSAALLMARLTADVRNSLINSPTPADALRQLNRTVVEQNLVPLRFITLALCVLDLSTGELIVSNAGHLPPLWRRGATGEVEEINHASHCTALGIDKEAGYQQTTVSLEPGDAVLLYTDGVSEARSADAEALYGAKRLQQQLAAAEGTAADMSTSILSDLRSFVGERGYDDDICLTCIQRNE